MTPQPPPPTGAVGRTNAPHLAVVVLNYRTPQETLAAVCSLQRSARPPDDILIVDNDSADGSEEQLRAALPDATILQTGRNLGYSGGNNAGIREALARGAGLVLILNSDVTVTPECLERLENAMAEDIRLGLVGPAVLSRSNPARIDSMGISFSQSTGRMRHPEHGHPYDSQTAPRVRIVQGLMGCAVLVRREVFERVGLLDEAYFFSMEDLDLCLRARDAGFASACVGRATALHGGSGSMGRGSSARMYFGVRNHLLLASRLGAGAAPARWLRGAAITGFNLAYVMRQPDMPRLEALRALFRGVRDHLAGRYGEGQFPRTDGPNQDTRRQSPPSGRL